MPSILTHVYTWFSYIYVLERVFVNRLLVSLKGWASASRSYQELEIFELRGLQFYQDERFR